MTTKAAEAVRAGILGILDGTTTSQNVIQEVNEIMAQETTKTRKPTARERAKAGVALPPEEIVHYEDLSPVKQDADRITPITEAPSLSPKGPRTLEDPVDNAKLVRMRAKWTAIRRERDVARLEEALEAAKTPAERREINGQMKTAKSVLVEAQVAERKAYKEYRDLLESRKAAKTASKTAGAAVADPEDLDATINAQRESR